MHSTENRLNKNTHLQFGQDFEFVTSHSVLATVSVSGHSEISASCERTQQKHNIIISKHKTFYNR